MYLDGSNATSAAFTGTCPPNVTNQLTVFAVFTVESGVQDGGRLFSLMYPDNNNVNSVAPLEYRTISNTMRVERNSVGYDGTSNAVPYGTSNLAACTVNGASTTVHVNGTQILTTSTVASNLAYTYYTIGCYGQARGVQDNGIGPWNGYTWKGYVGEVILYSNALSTAQRQQVEGYLAWKWNLAFKGPVVTTLSYTGSLQTYTVPAGVSNLYVYMWGGGGGAAAVGVGTGRGGAGAYIQGVLTTTPGETLSIIVAGGGSGAYSGPSGSGGYGGGGNANRGGNTYAGGPTSNAGNGSGGGGRSAIQRSGTEIVTVGGGGGAGYGQGGAAAWTGTATAGTGNGGGGGTPTGGGAYGSGGNPTSFGVGTAGTQLQGGNGNNFGGGGGGGWWGGGGGATTGGLGGDGGGGSSYTSNLASATGSNGSGGTAPGTALSYYVAGVAVGGFANGGGSNDGSNGLVVLSTGSLSSLPVLPVSHPFYSIRPGLRTFRPIDIDGCALWLDANDATTLTLSGSNITSWNDKSGNANNANIVTATPPTYSSANKAVVFTASNAMGLRGNMSTSLSNASVFVVASYTSNSATVYSPRLFFLGSNNSAENFLIGQLNLMDQGQPAVINYIGNGTGNAFGVGNYQTGGTITFARPFLYTNISTYSGSTFALTTLVNGGAGTYATKTGTMAVTPPYYVGSANRYAIGNSIYDTPGANGDSYNGNVYEVIVYPSALTNAQRQQVETYLVNKWKITIPTVGVSSTTPSLTNCKLWLDGADILGTGAPAPATVTTWADKSGTSNTVTANLLTAGQAIASSPMGPFMNGACYFSITGGLVNSIANTPFVIFIVETLALTAGTPFFFGNDTVPGSPVNNTLHIGYRNSGNFTFAFYANDIEVYQAFSNAVTRVWAFYLPSSGNRTVRLNGSTVGTGNTTRLGSFTSPVIGRIFGNYNDAYYGTISEILVYNADIGVPAIQTIESYLMAKWQPGTLVPKFTIPAGIALPFSPLQISGCTLWLDANDPAGTGTQPSAGALASWKDKTGSNNHMTAAGTTPTFSNVPPGAVTFGGAGYYSNATPVFSNFYTAFFVYKQTGGGPLYTTGASSGSNGLFPNESGTTYFTRGDSTWYTTSSPFTCNVVNLAVASFSSNAVGSNQSLFYNGSNVVTTTQSNTITYTNLLIGSRQSGGTAYFNGSIYEVVAYNGTLSTDLRQRVEGYLAQKWKV
jgi:hypothetical protein